MALNRQDLEAILPDKYNLWCHKRPLISSKGAQSRIVKGFSTRPDLTPSERAAFFLNDLTGCKGFEFVAFSNARINWAVRLSNRVVLVPCFLVDGESGPVQDPVFQATIRMQKKGRFIYDGWIPVEQWDDDHVHGAIQGSDEALSVCSAVGAISLSWEAKYRAPRGNLFCDVEPKHLNGLEQIAQSLDSLRDRDRIAVAQSLAWVSHGIRLHDATARFLFSVLAIESLATYIERGSDSNSPFFKLKTRKSTKADEAECIRGQLSKWEKSNPRKAVEQAYSQCLSITGMLKTHLAHVLGSESAAYNLMFALKKQGTTLYDLRHAVAHGRARTLSEKERNRIRQRVSEVEAVARSYILTVLRGCLGLNIQVASSSMGAALSIDPLDMLMCREGMYQGPTHMGLVYW